LPFKPARDVGLVIHGKVADGLLAYNLGWYGGVGQSKVRSGSNNGALGARVAINPFGEMPYSEGDLDHSQKPLLGMGVGYFMDTLKKTGTSSFESNNLSFAGSSGWLGKGASTFGSSEKVDIDTLGFDLGFKWMGFSAQGEYFWGQATGQNSDAKIRAHGYYAQAGYFVIPKHLELAMRYSYVDPNRDVSNDRQMETQGAISYYFNKHNLKLQGDVSNIHKENGTSKKDTDDVQYRVQAQIIF